MHLDIALLADAKGAVGGLILHRGIPPAVKVEDMAGAGQVEANATGFEREDKDWRTIGLLLKLFHHALARFGWGAAVEKERGHPQLLLQIAAQQLAHLGKLGEDQHPVADCGNLFEHLDQAAQLAAAFLFGASRVIVADLVQILGRVVADLLELHEHTQHLAAPRHLILGVVDLVEGLAHHRFVEGCLLFHQGRVDLGLGLLRQILNHGRVGFDAAQNEGADQFTQLLGALLVLVTLNWQGKALAEMLL